MPNVLIIGFVWPEPNSSAAGSRMMQIINAFQKNDFKVTFSSACAKTNNAFNLDCLGITSKVIELNSSTFDDYIKQLNPEIVVFDRFMTEEQFGWRVAENCPDTLRILDTEDLHFLRKGRYHAFKEDHSFDDSFLFNDYAKREIASIYRCDLTLIISEFEMKILKEKFKVDEALLHYLPFILKSLNVNDQDSLPTFEDRNHFITIGNFLHKPNSNSVLTLKKSIWPLIRKQLPHAELHVYGAYPSQKMLELTTKKEGFLVKGYATDVNKVMQNSKICIAPLQFGAGLKGKLIDAMINGTPCVTSSIGAEGMFGDLQPNGFVEDDHCIFAKKAIELYNNKALWYEKQHHGFNIINQRFNENSFMPNLISKINTLINNLSQHRMNNFTGAMLLHHSLQSTKYMSRWIEEKNRNKNGR